MKEGEAGKVCIYCGELMEADHECPPVMRIPENE